MKKLIIFSIFIFTSFTIKSSGNSTNIPLKYDINLIDSFELHNEIQNNIELQKQIDSLKLIKNKLQNENK